MSSLLQHLPWLRITAALVGWVVLPGGASAPTPAQSASNGPVHVESAGSLAPAYKLAVVDVPPPPPELTAGLEFVTDGEPSLAARAALEVVPAEPEGAADPTTCPLQVRAVVLAEDAADSFAMVATEAGSVLVRKGSGVRAGGRLGSVAALEDGVVILRVGTSLVRCGLE
jgi:hypothetical protein